MAGLIVEGPDGVGKTELIRKIQHKTFHPVVHLVQPGTPDIRQMFRLLHAGPIIFDRFHLSPVVYGEVLRQGSELDEHDTWALEGLLVALGYRMVICVTPTEVAVENNRRKKQLWEEVRDEKVVDSLTEGYVREWDRTPIESFLYDYTKHAELTVLGWALEERPTAPRGVIGSPRPKRWLVGDIRNEKVASEFAHVPFYWPSIGHKLVSGTVLSRAMGALGWAWDDTAVSNSVFFGHDVDLQEQYEVLGEPEAVIALGRRAASRLESTLIPFAEVPHPQWWRRFKHYDLAGYIELLENADVT